MMAALLLQDMGDDQPMKPWQVVTVEEKQGRIQTFGKGGSKSEYPFIELLKGTPFQIFNDAMQLELS